MNSYKLDTDNCGCDEMLVGDSLEEVTQDVLNRYEVNELPDGWTITVETQTGEMKMSEIENSEAYNTGFEASAQSDPRTANPYAAGTWDSDAWFAGWDAR